jgi:HD superfamily phosphohydrolase
MKNVHRIYEIRCPVHGFIHFNDWERTVVSRPAFQRLRRIRQLALTDQVYPGAMHTRFEHSLGVMHTATLLYDAILQNSREILKSDLAYNDAGLARDRQLVRFAALLHDVGHAPFSHGSEELFPVRENGTKYAHEDYSASIVRTQLRSAIEEHPLNTNYGFRADDIAGILEGSATARQAVFWRDLIAGQMDADRMDYLLRDSYHIGVQYGRFDVRRLIGTIRAIPAARGHPPRLGISEGGWHAAEGLVLARYFMFTQVYFHKTRVAYDIHLRGALATMLPGGHFPPPTDERLEQFLQWDDWRVLGLVADGKGGEHGERVATRNHYRRVYRTAEVPREIDLDRLRQVKDKLGGLLVAEEPAAKSWYKTGRPDIPVVSDISEREVLPLSKYSGVVENLKGNSQVLLYSRPEDATVANKIIGEVTAQWQTSKNASL